MLAVSERESIIIMEGNMEAGPGVVAKCYILICRKRQREILGLVWTFETSKTMPTDKLPPTRPHLPVLLILLYSATP